jgi:phage terminase large subunit GpA-like protein
VRRISQELPGKSWEEAFVHAHNQFERELLDDYPDLNLMLKDWSDGGQMPLIRYQIAASKDRSRIRASKGFAVNTGRKPIHLWGDPVRDKSGTGWVERRSENPQHVQFDANVMKSMAARRLLTVSGAPSSVLLPGVDERLNRLLVEHFTAEQPKEKSIDGAKGITWVASVGRDNDWWDCFVGCITAASVLGCKLNGDTGTGKKETRTFALPGGARRG